MTGQRTSDWVKIRKIQTRLQWPLMLFYTFLWSFTSFLLCMNHPEILSRFSRTNWGKSKDPKDPKDPKEATGPQWFLIHPYTVFPCHINMPRHSCKRCTTQHVAESTDTNLDHSAGAAEIQQRYTQGILNLDSRSNTKHPTASMNIHEGFGKTLEVVEIGHISMLLIQGLHLWRPSDWSPKVPTREFCLNGYVICVFDIDPRNTYWSV